MATKSTDVTTRTIPVDIAFLISDHLEIPDMENWAGAVVMGELFRLTFRAMQRLIPQTESRSKWYEENLDENDDMSSTRVYFDFMRVGNDKAFLELHFTIDDVSDDFQTRHISDLTRPLTQEMVNNLLWKTGLFPTVTLLTLFRQNHMRAYGSVLWLQFL